MKVAILLGMAFLISDADADAAAKAAEGTQTSSIK